MTVSEFLVPDGMTVAGAGETLVRRLDARHGHWSQSDRCYYDTFDGLLRERRMTAVHHDGQLELIDGASGQTVAAQRMRRPTHPLLSRDLAPGRLRDQLSELIDVRALLPLIEVQCRERSLAVLNGERKTVVRMKLQQPTVARRTLRPRVQLVGVRGYDKALRRVSHALAAELGFDQAEQPVLDEAIRAVGGTPGGTSSKISVALEREQRADSAAVSILIALLDVIEANIDGAIADLDSEFLHDLRVSVRRSRAVQRELRHVFPPAELDSFRHQFRWLQLVTGDARDLDVYVLEFDAMRALVPEPLRSDLDTLLAVLRRRRAAARRRMVRALRSKRTSTLLAQWREFLEALEGRSSFGRPDSVRTIGEVAGGRIARVYARMVRMGEAIGDSSPPGSYHELRKQGKELRYLLELFGAPLYPPAVVKPMIKSLKALQDVLGRHQDREIQIETLRSMGDELSATPNGAAALMAMGVLLERLAEDQLEARASFAQRFNQFASSPQRRLVRHTFSAR
jgi:CHAD domain-containing protein